MTMDGTGYTPLSAYWFMGFRRPRKISRKIILHGMIHHILSHTLFIGLYKVYITQTHTCTRTSACAALLHWKSHSYGHIIKIGNKKWHAKWQLHRAAQQVLQTISQN